MSGAVTDHAAASGFQREEVDATERSSHAFTSHVDPRGLSIATDTAGRLVESLPGVVRDWRIFRDEVTLVIEPGDLLRAATWLRDEAGFAMLADLTPTDWLGSATGGPKRFSVNYHVLKLVVGAPRLRLQVWVDEGETVPSLIDVWPTADWHEREAFDFMGVEFTGREGLRRLIMPEDWVGHPLRKDYPLGGEPVKFTNSLREI